MLLYNNIDQLISSSECASAVVLQPRDECHAYSSFENLLRKLDNTSLSFKSEKQTQSAIFSSSGKGYKCFFAISATCPFEETKKCCYV